MDLTLKGRDLFAILQTVPGVYLGTTYLTGGDATSEGNGMGSLADQRQRRRARELHRGRS